MPDTAQPQARAPEASHHPVTCAGTACPCYQEGLGNQVHQVPPGSVVALRGDHDPDHLGILAAELANAAGHHQFVLDPQAVADLLGLARPELAPPAPCPQCGYCRVSPSVPLRAELLDLAEPERVRQVRTWRDQVAGRYGPGAPRPTGTIELNNQAWWADVNALLQYVDQLAHPLPAVRSCRVCGCTDAWACPGGCSWAAPGLCSTCADRPAHPELLLTQHHSTVPPPERAAWLLRNVRQRGDDYGDVANATGDELRDALVLAAAALNAAQAPDVTPEASTVAFLAAGAVATDAPDVAQAYLDAHQGMPHAALLVGGSTTCPCGEATTAPVHQGTFRVPAAAPVPDLMANLEASLAATRAYLAAHPPEPEPVTDEDRRLGYRLTGDGNEDLRRMARLHAAGVPKEG